MGEPEHCGDPSCLICYPAITKTGHQITHDEIGRWAAEAEQGIRAYSGPAEVSSRSSEQMRGVPGSSRSSGVYRFRIRHTGVDLRLVSMGELRHDRGPCLSACCT